MRHIPSAANEPRPNLWTMMENVGNDRCCMMLYDVVWCCMMLYDVVVFKQIFQEISHQNLVKPYKVSIQKVPRAQIYTNLSPVRCFQHSCAPPALRSAGSQGSRRSQGIHRTSQKGSNMGHLRDSHDLDGMFYGMFLHMFFRMISVWTGLTALTAFIMFHDVSSPAWAFWSFWACWCMLMLRTSIWIAFPWCFAHRELRSTTSIWTPGWKHLHMALARHGLPTNVVSKNLGNPTTTSKRKEQSKDVENIRIALQFTASLRNNTVIRMFYGVLVMAMAFKSQSSGPQVAKRISTDKDRFSRAKPRVHLMPTTGIP